MFKGASENFLKKLQALSEEYGDEFLELNGFHPDQLNYGGFVSGFTSEETQADASIDGNANSGSKDVCALEAEMSKPQSKLLSFNKIYYELEKRLGVDFADKWLEEEYTGAFYLHDASSATMKPYCYAYDLKDLAERGLFFVDNFSGGAPKHLSTFVDFVGEFVSYTSNRTSGACGLPNYLIYAFYFWKKDCEGGFATKSPEYHMRQEFQRIIYKLNQPYLRVSQSAFTNFSIYDRPYLEALFGGAVYPDGSFVIDFIDEILEYQKVFMEVLSEVRSKNMMTFPVMTFALLWDGEKFVDEEWAKWASSHNRKWNDSNFFISEDVTTLSNCCRLLSNIDSLGYFNSIGGTALSVGSIKVNTINLARIAYEADGDKEEYLEILSDRVNTCLEVLHTIRHIITRNVEKGLLPNYMHGLIQMAAQYNTIGITGVYETLKYMEHVKVDEFGNASYDFTGVEFMENVLSTIHEVKDFYLEDKDYMANIEQVPKLVGTAAA